MRKICLKAKVAQADTGLCTPPLCDPNAVDYSRQLTPENLRFIRNWKMIEGGT
jgi:hypothetical protein